MIDYDKLLAIRPDNLRFSVSETREDVGSSRSKVGQRAERHRLFLHRSLHISEAARACGFFWEGLNKSQ